jgi:AcrR family transcriptional regulator
MADDTAPPGMHIPASIEAAWGLRERPPRGPKPGLSLDRIVAAAIAVADAEGYAAVSMSRVAAELGSSAMSLYRYVGSKDELLALMFDAEMGAPPVLEAGDWRGGLARWTTAALDLFMQAPWSVRIPIPAPPITPNQIRWLEAALGCLRGSGLTEPEKLSTVLLLSGLARYHATVAADTADNARATGLADPSAGYGSALMRLARPEDFPAVYAAVLSGSLDDDSADFAHEELRFGLDRILDGLAALISRRPATE